MVTRRAATRRGSTWAGTRGSRRARDRCSRRSIGDALRRGASPEFRHLLPDDHADVSVIANLFFGQVTRSRASGGISGITAHAGLHRPRRRAPEPALLRRPRRGAAVYVLLRYVVRTPFGLALQGVRDDPVRMASLGYNVMLHRTLAFAFAGFVAALARRALRLVERAARPRPSIDLSATIDLLVIAVIGGPTGSRARGSARSPTSWISNEVTNRIPEGGLWLIGGSFNTVIGLAFLAIVDRLAGRVDGHLGSHLVRDAGPRRDRRARRGRRLRGVAGVAKGGDDGTCEATPGLGGV